MSDKTVRISQEHHDMIVDIKILDRRNVKTILEMAVEEYHLRFMEKAEDES